MKTLAILLGMGTALTFQPSLVAAQQRPIFVYPVSPAFPLFRCDGQRPPIFGGGDCANWRVLQKQERLLDLQIKEMERRKRRRHSE